MIRASFVGDCVLVFNLTLVVVAVAYWRSRGGGGGWLTGKGDQDTLLDGLKPNTPMTSKRREERAARSGFALLRESDPVFDIDDFYRRVSEMFADLQAAARGRNLAPTARYIESTAFAELQARVAAIPIESALGDLSIQRVRAVAVRREGDQDLVRVMLTAVSDSAGVDPITGVPLTEGNEVRFYAQEHWTLMRAVGAKTLPDATIYRCPNCGAPITATARAACAYCHTRLCDPNRDWVVSEIAGD